MAHTSDQLDSQPAAQEAWQSWGLMARYVIFCVAQAIPAAALAWLAYLHR